MEKVLNRVIYIKLSCFNEKQYRLQAKAFLGDIPMRYSYGKMDFLPGKSRLVAGDLRSGRINIKAKRITPRLGGISLEYYSKLWPKNQKLSVFWANTAARKTFNKNAQNPLFAC